MKFKILSTLIIYFFLSTISFSTKKIISTTPAITEILIDIGLAKNLIAVDQVSKRFLEIPENIVSLSFNEIDIELFLKLNPDIVIVSEHNFKGNHDFLELLKIAGINVLYTPTPKNISEITSVINQIGIITQKEIESNKLIDNFLNKLKKIKESTKNLQKKKKIYFEINPEPQIFSFGSNTFLHDMIDIVGGENIFENNNGWFLVSKEIILEKDPDIIFTNFPSTNAVENILQREYWQNLSAIKNKKVFYIDESSLRPSHRIISALEQMKNFISEDL